MTPAAATAPARPFPAGSTSSSRRSGTCAPPGPPWSMWSGPRPRPAPARPRGRSRTCCAGAGGRQRRGWRPAGHHRRRVQRRRADRRPRRPGRASAGPPAGHQRVLLHPVTWPGKNGRPGKHGIAVTCHNDPGQANPEPDQSLILPDTPLYGTVRVSAWHQVHPLIHGDRGWFADNWEGELPFLRGTVLRVIVEHLPDGRKPHKTMWLWHAALARCRWTSCGAPTWPGSTKSTPSSSPRHPRPDRRQSPHPRPGRPVGPPGHGRLRPAAPGPPARRRPAPPLGNPAPRQPPAIPRPGPPRVCKHPRPPGHPRPCRKTRQARTRTPQGTPRKPAPRYPVPKKTQHHRQAKP